MSLLKRLLGIDSVSHHEEVAATQEALDEARTDLRQKVQVVQSGARSLSVMETWRSAAELLIEKDKR